MPRESRVPPAVRRQWLSEWEQGKRVDAIARDAHRNQRTVSGQISRARQEREQDIVHAELLKEGYKKHLEDLLSLAQQLRDAARVPAPEGYDEARLRESWFFRTDGLVGTPPGASTRNVLLFRALQQHIPKGPLWKARKDWQECAQVLNNAARDLRSMIAGRVEATLQTAGLAVNTSDFVGTLWYAVRMHVLGSDPSQVEYHEHESPHGVLVAWDAFNDIAETPDEKTARAVEVVHRELMVELIGSDLTKRLKEAYQRWQRARDMVDTEVEIMSLRNFLPGICDLCPGSVSNRRAQGQKRRSQANENI